MNENLTFVEIIGLAIRSEEDAADFYGRVSKLIKNDLVRAKYESLAKEEVAHRHMLLELFRKMTGDRNAIPKIPGQPKTAEGGHPDFVTDSIEELLKFAIKKENWACEFYKSAAKQAVEANSKQILNYLSDIEHGHEMLLKTELDNYLRNANWYAEKPDIQLVGP